MCTCTSVHWTLHHRTTCVHVHVPVYIGDCTIVLQVCQCTESTHRYMYKSVLDIEATAFWMICCPATVFWMICFWGYSIWMICCPGYSILDNLLSRLQCFCTILQKLSNAKVIHTCMNQYSCMVKFYCVSIYSCMDLLIIAIFSTIISNCPCYNTVA